MSISSHIQMQKHNIAYPLISVLLFALSPYSMAMATWKDNIPSALTPFQNNPQQLAGLVQDNIFIYGHPAVKTTMPTQVTNPVPTANFTTAAIIVPVAAADVAKTLGNYSQYVGLFPTLKSAKILEQANNISQVKYKVSIPTPIKVLNFNEDVTLQHQLGNNSLATLIIDAPIPFAVSKFEWFNLGNNRTLITLTHWGDLNQPKGFLFKKILNALPEAKLGIPSGTGAFVMEALKNRFSAKKVTALAAGQLPSPVFNAAQINKIAQLSQNSGQSVSVVLNPTTVPYTHGAEALRFTTTYQYLNRTPQQLQSWTTPQSYQQLFPNQIKEIKTTPLTAQGLDAAFKVSVGLGVINIPFNFNMHFSYPKVTENNFYANGGDVRYLKGNMQFNPLGNVTLLKMTTAMKIDDQAPFLLRAMRSLPYHEMLPAVGGNAVFTQKIKAR